MFKGNTLSVDDLEKQGFDEQFVKQWDDEVALLTQIGLRINPLNENKLEGGKVRAFF